MDTTAIEYELEQLKKEVAILIRKTSGAIDPMPDKPTTPKFWMRYSLLDATNKKTWIVDYSRNFKDDPLTPVYCFTREMLIAMGVDLIDWNNQMTATKVMTFLDSYLKSEGEV